MVLAGGASHKRLSVATTYEEWSEIAQELDEKSGALRWKQEEKDTRYDYRRIRERLDMLRHARGNGGRTRITICTERRHPWQSRRHRAPGALQSSDLSARKI